MEDAELRNILFSIQGSIAGFQNDMSDVKNDIADMKTDIANMKTDIIDRKISALFDSRMDELRYRKENKETREKVFELDMRVDNLEKAIMPA